MSKNDRSLSVADWKVEFTGKAAKQYVKLPERIKVVIDALVIEIQQVGNSRKLEKLQQIRPLDASLPSQVRETYVSSVLGSYRKSNQSCGG